MIEEFIPDIHHKYLLQNYKTSSTYRSYNDIVPPYLHDFPQSVILHCLERKSNSRKFNVEHVLTQDQQNGILPSKVLQIMFILLTLEGLLKNHLIHASTGPSGISLASTFLLYSALFPIILGTVCLLVTEAVLIYLLTLPCRICHQLPIYCQVAVQQSLNFVM